MLLHFYIPSLGLLFIPQVICEYGELWWNDIDEETRELGRETCSNAILSRNPT
jgi:hypothetical protein